MLGGLAMKWRWRQRQEAAGKATDRPNMVLGSNVQVVWEKFCRYWDVEPRYVPVAHDRYVVDPDDVMERVDENTIGVIPILGTTFTGEFEPIGEIHDRVVAYNEAHGLDIPIHVDAASGGFVAPFLHPDLEWDFRLPQVKSINVSGHKYGLTYPGIGFVIWRSQDDLPEDLVFHVNYLGGDMPTFTLNFSRPGNQLVGQYYNFVRLGREGFTRIMEQLRDIAVHLSSAIAEMGAFEVISDGTAIPVHLVPDGRPVEVHGVPRLGSAPDRRVAGARLHDAGRRDGRGRPPHRRARGVQHGPRRLPAARDPEGPRPPRGLPPAAAAAGGAVQPHLTRGRTRVIWRRVLRSADRGLGWRIAVLFMVGSFLFALGSFPLYAQNIDPGTVGVTFVVGSVFFTAAAASQLLLTAREDGARILVRACQVQLAGTFFFNFSTADAMLASLDTEETNRLVWAPDMFGSVAFLVASHLAWLAVCHRLWCVRRDDEDWWIAALNYVGSIFFMLSAIASLTLTTTGEVVNLTLVNLGTFVGAVCFLVGAYLLLPAARCAVDAA